MRKKEMDNLSRCAKEARQAGLTYGQYMATRQPAMPTDAAGETVKCAFCGKEFRIFGRVKRKYCDAYCRERFYAMQEKERVANEHAT